MAQLGVFVAMAQEGDGASAAELLEEAEREFLAVVFDERVAAVDGAAFAELLAVEVFAGFGEGSEAGGG